jgi:sec-independent protein translocase protein TatA
MSVGPSEVVVILLVVFLLFGSRRLADLGKGIGEGIRGFKRGIADETRDADTADEKATEPPRQLVGRIATSEELGTAAPSLSSSMTEPGDSGMANMTATVAVANEPVGVAAPAADPSK